MTTVARGALGSSDGGAGRDRLHSCRLHSWHPSSSEIATPGDWLSARAAAADWPAGRRGGSRPGLGGTKGRQKVTALEFVAHPSSCSRIIITSCLELKSHISYY